ncbi:ATP-binding protein [Sphaerisporangium viridialbum]|uniref:ATP-binding protein n=1 Tax=Sphaerisporangium viridialbum TaxID=46189 RepID=UPI003C762006
MLQESLSNAMRHAPGSSVTIEISRTAAELRLRVANGPGRPALRPVTAGRRPGARPSPGGGQGIIGMRERATLLGGALDTAPIRDGGFTVTATLPILEER